MDKHDPADGAIREGEPPFRAPSALAPSHESTKLSIAGRLKFVVATTFFLALAAGAVSWWYFDLGHERVEKLPWLHGMPLAIVIAELGEPSSQLEFMMGTCPGGVFRVGLFNTYPPKDPKFADVRIQEMQWHSMRYHVAVWMHQVNGEWIVLDTCRWREGIDF